MSDLIKRAEHSIGQLASGIISAPVLDDAVAVLIQLVSQSRAPEPFETWQDAALDERVKRIAAEQELDRAYSMLSVYGVPKERARTVSNGICVLVTRMDKEIDALKWNLAQEQAKNEANQSRSPDLP